MAYKRISDFDVDSPQELRRDLQQMDRQIAQAFTDLLPPPFSAVRRLTANDTAHLGDLIVIDTSGGSLKLTLPKISELAGLVVPQAIGIVMSNALNSLTVQCVGTDVINRASTLVLSGTVGFVAYIVFDGLEYWKR